MSLSFEGGEKSEPWEGAGGTWDEEIGGSISEKLDMGVRTSSKWNMKNHIVRMVGQGICYQESGTFNQSAFRIACLSSGSGFRSTVTRSP